MYNHVRYSFVVRKNTLGYRFRKSINLGGGFKINLSKSGIGYSWGIPGMRYSVSANGRERQTYSIPGTGISYVEEGSSNRNSQQNNYRNAHTSVDIVEEKVSSTDFEGNSDYDEFINKINAFRTKDKAIKTIITILSAMFLFIFANILPIIIGLILFGIYILYRNSKMIISIEYDFDNENERYYKTINNLFSTIASSRRLWLIESMYKNVDIKRNAGVDSCIERIPISITEKVPYYIRTNVKCNCLSIKDKHFYFLPNKVLVHSRNKTIGLDFQDLCFNFGETTFVEQLGVPSDTEVLEYTYQYVNKNGGPDKRYKYNPQYPKCLYGTIDITNGDGLNLSMMLSSKSKTIQAKQIYENLGSVNFCTTKKCISCGGNISYDANFCKYCGNKQ